MLVTILTIAQLVYVVVLATWILFEKRSPVATLAWILSLIALPYVGFVVFFLFGPRRLLRRRLKHKRARGAVTATTPLGASEPPPAQHDPRVEQLVHLVKRMGEPPASQCDTVEIFHDATDAYDAIVEAIREAKHHVHVAYYIFAAGRCGERFRQVLIERAKAGVTVRLLVDDVGSSSLGRKFVKPMRDAGIKFARFNEVAFSRIRSRVDFRNHRKIVVVDGVVGFTGGVNISDDYLPADERETKKASERLHEAKNQMKGHQRPWRDTHVKITGDAVRWLQLTFLDDWYYVTKYAARDRAYFPAQTRTGKHLVQIVASGPDRDVEPIQKLYFSAIAMARERVYVTTPYFVPDDAVLTSITTAAMRGVDVRVLVPRRSDSLIVTAAARSYYDALLAAGVRVYEYQPTMIHSKTFIADGLWGTIGSMNFDNRSLAFNNESNLVFLDSTQGAQLDSTFFDDLSRSKEIILPEFQKRPWYKHVIEDGAAILSRLL